MHIVAYFARVFQYVPLKCIARDCLVLKTRATSATTLISVLLLEISPFHYPYLALNSSFCNMQWLAVYKAYTLTCMCVVRGLVSCGKNRTQCSSAELGHRPLDPGSSTLTITSLRLSLSSQGYHPPPPPPTLTPRIKFAGTPFMIIPLDWSILEPYSAERPKKLEQLPFPRVWFQDKENQHISYWHRFLGPYCILRVLVFPLPFMVRAWALNRWGKTRAVIYSMAPEVG